MEQQFEGTPQAEIRLEGRKLVRGDVANDWGSQLLWRFAATAKSSRPCRLARTTATNTPTRLPASTKSSCKCSSTKATPRTPPEISPRASSSRSRIRSVTLLGRRDSSWLAS